MATSSIPTYCDWCHARHITKPVEVYCPQCEETLCVDCMHNHKTSKFTKSHQTITLDEFNKLPPFIQQIKQYCDDHGDIFEFHCPDHDALCCKRCITSTHNKCTGILVIEDMLKTCDSSATLDSLERTLQDIETNIDQVFKDRQQNLQDLQSQKTTVSSRIKEKRKEINRYLAKLEEDILKKLEEIENENRKKIEHLINEIEKVQSQAEECKRNIRFMKEYASSIQVFMGTRKLQEKVASPEKYIQTLYTNGRLNYKHINLLVNKQIDRLTTDISTFGNLEVKEGPTTIKMLWQSQKGAQIFAVPRKPYSIDDTQLQMIQKINIQQLNIPGCLLVQGKYLYFATQNDKMVLKYDVNGTLVSSLKIYRYCFDILLLDNKTVLVTNGYNKKNLVKFDVEHLLTKQITCNIDWFFGATLYGGKVISCTHDNGIKCFQISGDNLISDKVIVKLDASFTYITSDTRYLYHSDYHTDSIKCFDYDGKSIWTFKDKLLKNPKGITIDSQSNIYVAGYDSNNIVVISPDGKRARQLLGPHNAVSVTHALYIMIRAVIFCWYPTIADQLFCIRLNCLLF